MHVVICGAGVIGASVAYFLACRGAKVTIVERVAPACAASGKSGGSSHSIGATARRLSS
jgi:glycine/D-amino acid oxidase-like deaminating enzyme